MNKELKYITSIVVMSLCYAGSLVSIAKGLEVYFNTLSVMTLLFGLLSAKYHS